MCGIVGLINTGNMDILKKLTKILAHRGPDDDGIKWFEESGSGLGHTRLAILELIRK